MNPERLRITVKTLRACFFICLILLLFLFTAIFTVYLSAKIQGPPSLTVSQSTILFAGDGTKMGETHHGQKRYWVKNENISPFIKEAAIAIEDRHFYEHHGFDIKRIAGAAAADLKSMSKVQGASTISQQYARNLFLKHDKTWTRKLDEAFYTFRLEANYSKDQILEGYLNTIYYGHGAYGIEAASNYYFGKKAKDLTLAEASMLAGVPKGPSQYSPLLHYTKAKDRQKTVLNAMVETGAISKAQAQEAFGKKLSFADHASQTSSSKIAPYFYDTAMQQARKLLHLSKDEFETSGLRIYTTLDPKLQTLAEQEIKRQIKASSRLQTGLLSLDPATGEVKAMVGGRSYEESPFNRATQAERQPGSTMKPLLYYSAITHGFTPSTMMKSEPTDFEYDNGKSTYEPGNYNGYFANAPISLAQAIAVSDNIYAVKTHLFLGMETLIDTARKTGITSPLKKVPSLALGTSPVRLSEMVNAYGILANGGKLIQPVYIKKIEDASGQLLYEYKQPEKRVLNEAAAFVTTELMTGMFDKKLNGYTSVTGNSIAGKLTHVYAGKSGSTSTDSWMIGYSPSLVTGIWTGYDKGQKMEEAEERGIAKTIWASFMEEALRSRPAEMFQPPNGVTGVYIDPASGKLSAAGCPVKRYVYYLTGTQPQEYCSGQKSAEEKPKQPKEGTKKNWWQKMFHW
ncbi:PBP1A family penicillin-binding protein [Metabacillus sp. GX 13764]|uniref:transglycosylase domain-containing protein n=1 Tax=Metabacillus kandeliae TaxID=2900151 RepID=UPI001E54488D|nr:PBP1A family penicillin-binding protein [Metabacillus kandeliae]MCD7034722.1 PBP1A family penicillin-binding protein [Metabacillus kandeliae]